MFSRIAILLAMSLALGCEPEQQTTTELPKVFVSPAEQISYHPVVEFNARLESRDEVQISALVSGELVAIHFDEGQRVEAGTPLFDIDPKTFVAQVAAAEADVARAQTTLDNDRKTLERGQQLIGDGYISQSELDQFESNAAASEAQLRASEAALDQARINLDHSKITAVASGRMSRSNFNIGEVVGPESGPLATLVGGQVMDVIFQINESDFFKAVRRGIPEMPLQSVAELELAFSDGSVYSQKGYLDYIGNRVNEQTASVEVRGVVPNSSGMLVPGQYVIARLTILVPRTVTVIPQSAVQVDQRGTYALSVDDEGMVSRANLELGQRVGASVIVLSGVTAGDDVIISGVQRVRAGQQAQKQLVESETAIPNAQ